jgi:hypothetical protein
MILPYDANPCRMEFSERTGHRMHKLSRLPLTQIGLSGSDSRTYTYCGRWCQFHALRL